MVGRSPSPVSGLEIECYLIVDECAVDVVPCFTLALYLCILAPNESIGVADGLFQIFGLDFLREIVGAIVEEILDYECLGVRLLDVCDVQVLQSIEVDFYCLHNLCALPCLGV